MLLSKKILKELSEVNLNDVWTLCEIDQMVHIYLPQNPARVIPANYTRSRDSLAAIRPKPADGGWYLWEIRVAANGSALCKITRHKDFGSFNTPWLASEKLAELYAIIVAWEFELTGVRL